MENQIDIAAIKLAITFSDESDVPSRFRKDPGNEGRNRKINPNSVAERRFLEEADHWKRLIEAMLRKIEPQLAWRFINISPRAEADILSVGHSREFSSLNDYLLLRRDTDKCGPEELGRLAMLSLAFQRKIESRILPG